ncbi:MAG TPA: hypothetical protein VFB32_15110 [Rudaea sp.]|jgi:hypothetical protein|nr:hypothetical protein [Rudaea sp.]
MKRPSIALLSFVLFASAAAAEPPVPLYSSNVVVKDRMSPSSLMITTRDSMSTVCAWYRRHLPDATSEKTTDDGAHIFTTQSGATVDVEAGTRSDPGTKIALAWDSAK